MLNIKNTENLTGVCISGDYNDLYALVDSFHAIAVCEFSDKHTHLIDMSTRVLGLCYDIRHAMQGDRDVNLTDNGMNEDKMKFHSTITPKNNVYYSCNYLYPEMFFVMIALNKLIGVRMQELAKLKQLTKAALDKKVIWDDTIVTLRLFQSEFQKCVKETISEASFVRWLKVMNDDIPIEEISNQYIDLLNIEYIQMDNDGRKKNLTKIARRIAGFKSDEEHNEIMEVVYEAAREYGCGTDEIGLKGFEYPDSIEW